MPGQAGVAPATHLVALLVGVLVALEAFQDVVTGVVTHAGGSLGGIVRAGTATAHEHYQGFWIHLAFQLSQEVVVGGTTGVVDPLNFHRVGDASHPVQFGPGAHIHQFGAGGQLPHLVGLGRGQGARVGKSHGLSPFLGQLQNVGKFSHGGVKA